MKNKKSRWLVPLLSIGVCVLVSLLAAWSDLTYNSGRLVYPMDSSYSFQPSDIPMLLALTLDAFCALTLLTLILREAIFRRRREAERRRTRQLNPRLGFLGLFGFCGFLGFLPISELSTYTPFVFFLFFGFFGFFYEGKMSNTLMDERYRENALRAERAAYKTGLNIIFLLLLIAGQGRVPAERMAAALLIGISLALGLTLFLGEYLLYRYDHADAAGLEDGE